MKRPIARYIHSMSLGARIVWVFVLTAVVSVMIFSGSFHLILNEGESQTFPRMINDYSDKLLTELGTPANRMVAKSIQQRTGINIVIESAGEKWSTFEPGLDKKHFFRPDKVEFHRHEGNKMFGFDRGIAYLKVKHSDETVWFTVSFRKNPAVGLVILTGFIALLVLWIYVAYRMISYLISPVKKIQEGVQKFSEGDFDWHIPVKRDDDLGVLTREINDMAGQIKQMLESKRQLLLAISHELRTPMTKLNIAVDLPESPDNRDIVKKALKQMEQLISELLESEKISANHSALLKEEVDICSLLSELVSQEFGEQDSIQYQHHAGPCMIQADIMRLRLMFRNLITNAVKYGEQKPVQVECFSQQSMVHIVIQDQGEGIASESLPRIFEPFYREDKARQRQTGGTGLGLYLVKLIVEAHQGKIDVESDKGIGTRVIVRLPITV